MLKFLISLAVVGSCVLAQDRERSTGYLVDSLETQQDFFRKHPTGKYEVKIRQRKEARRELQRRGYSDVLYDVTNADGIQALISLAKMKIQIEFSLPHNVLFWIRRPVPELGITGIPFREDWEFPEDPWKKD